jgi:hypothetical protein
MTSDEWNIRVLAGRCYRPSDEGWSRGRRPVDQRLSWDDAQAYIDRLSEVAQRLAGSTIAPKKRERSEEPPFHYGEKFTSRGRP